MKVVIQRVSKAEVNCKGKIVGKINKGFLVLLGIKKGDTKEQADYLVKKLLNLRIFEDENGKMNLSIKDVQGELLIVSQFTLYGDASHGNRPSFTKAELPDKANKLYEYFCNECRKSIHVETGIFQQEMAISLINNGPTTIIIEK